MLTSFSKYSFNKHISKNTFFRLKSAWLNANNVKNKEIKVDVESLFISKDVQKLLQSLTGLDPTGKIFKEKTTNKLERSHFALMTDEAYHDALKKMEDMGRKFLQFVPLKEPRSTTINVLEKAPEIANFDTSKFIFTDITYDATDQDRTVVVREPDGTLRDATPSEHDRMNRFFYEKPNRPVFEPALFSGKDLENALDTMKHAFVLDWACWFYEPDDPKFVELSKKIFEEIIMNNKFDILHSTRHYGHFLFYCALNKQIAGLLNHYGKKEMVTDAANFIKLYKIIYPDWRNAVSVTDSDYKVVQDFLRLKVVDRKDVADLAKLVTKKNKY
uniref:28S ribosomal protein S22, mitochondrial (inferred by orthology to a human protein) n=1 Tax=Strongyloides venezuelensis TaxID=75913 RepID=A0A0K0FEW4_STRVS